MDLPKTQEEWFELFVAYRSTEGCGCCRDTGEIVGKLRTAVFEAIPSKFPDVGTPGDRSPEDDAAVKLYFAEQEMLRKKWVIRLGGTVEEQD